MEIKGGTIMINHEQLDQEKLAIGAKVLLTNSIFNKAFRDVTSDLTDKVFTVKDGGDRDKIAHYKSGMDLFVLKLQSYINDSEMSKHMAEKEKKSELSLL